MPKKSLELSTKEVILTAIATLLALGSFVADDLYVVFTILTISAILLIALCVLHSGRKLYRSIFAVASVLGLVFIGWRSYQHVTLPHRAIQGYDSSDSPQPKATEQAPASIKSENSTQNRPTFDRPAPPHTRSYESDLDVLEFSSLGVIEIRNNTRQTVTILSLECNLMPQDGGDGASTIEAMSIPPKSIQKFNFPPMIWTVPSSPFA